MKRTFTILLFVIAAALFFISLFSLFIVSTPLERRMLDASVTISSNKGGFDVNQSALTFGIVTPGSSSTRTVSVDNPYSFPIILRISSAGPIDPFLSYTSVVAIPVGESKRISFSIVSDQQTPLGFYPGQVTFTFYPGR